MTFSMSIKKLSLFALFIFSIKFAYDVRFTEVWCIVGSEPKDPTCKSDPPSPYYPNSDTGPFFSTDLNMKSDYQLSLVSGKVADGVDPLNIKPNDIVCPGSTLKLTPRGQSTYADNHLQIYSVYFADYKAAWKTFPLPGPGTKQKGNIKYVSKADYDFLNLFDENWNKPDSQKGYNILQPFIDEPVIYRGGPWSPSVYFNSQVGAAVACYGNYVANDNGNVVGTKDLTALSPIQFSINTPGSHTITTQFTGLNCMGAVLLYPRQNVPGGDPIYHQTWYYKNNQVSGNTFDPYPISYGFPTSMSVNVQDGSGTCDIEKESLVKDTKMIGSDEYSLVNLKVKNQGTASVKITQLFDATREFEVIPSDDPICMSFGGMCPKSGLNETISAGDSKNILFYAKRKSAGDGLFAAIANITDGGCSDGSCLILFNLNTSGYSCDINPKSISLKSGETYNFKTSCTVNGTSTSCFGNWSSSGNILSQDVTNANISFSSDGNVTYMMGDAVCMSQVKIQGQDKSKGSCKINGPSMLYHHMLGNYNVTCFDNKENSVTCDSVEWKGSIDYQSRNQENATISAQRIGTFNSEVVATIKGTTVTCDKNIDIVKNKCAFYS